MRKMTVEVPGSCGELLQGTRQGVPLLVTCPIDCYSRATIYQGDVQNSLSPKAAWMATLASEFYGVSLENLVIELSTELPIGKGMSSSSADIAAVAAGIAQWGGKKLNPEEILALCQKIEPTDGTFFEGILCLDHIEGSYYLALPTPPKIKIQIFDCGDGIDTMEFNRRTDLQELNRKKEPVVEQAFEYLQKALGEGNARKLAEAATSSALAHQKILPKPHLEQISNKFAEWGALGLNVAHSGTVIGILWEEDRDELMAKVQKELPKIWPEYRFLRNATLIGGGIVVKEVSD